MVLEASDHREGMTDDWTGSETVPSMNPGPTAENGVYDKIAHRARAQKPKHHQYACWGRELLTLQDGLTSQAIRPTRNVMMLHRDEPQCLLYDVTNLDNSVEAELYGGCSLSQKRLPFDHLA